VQYWLGVGAQPTEAVTALLKITGDYQKANGLPGTEGTLKPQPVRIDKRVAYEAAVKEAMAEPADGATTLSKRLRLLRKHLLRLLRKKHQLQR
jgi:small subunit ribosomal protein S16